MRLYTSIARAAAAVTATTEMLRTAAWSWRSHWVSSGVTYILAGSAAGQGLVILCYPLLTRLYGPTDFGLFVVFTSVVSLVGVLSTASLEAAVLLPKADEDAASVAWASIASVILGAMLTAAVGWLAGPSIADLLRVPGLAALWWLASLTVLVLGAYQVLSEWMIRERSYRTLGLRNLLQGIGQVVTQVGLGLGGVRPIGLVLGLAVGRLLGTGGLASRGGLLRQPRPRRAGLAAAIWRYRRFPLVASWSKLLNTAGLEAPLLIISAMYGDVRAGLLGLVVRVVGGPAAVIGNAVYQVFTGEASARVRAPDAMLASFARSTVLRLLAIGIGPTAALVVLSPTIFNVVFGEEWIEAGKFAQLLAIPYLAGFAVVPISNTLFLLEHQGRQLAWDSTRLVLTSGGPIICGLIGASATTAVAVLSISQVASYALLYNLSIKAARASDYRRAKQ
jgi:O-antigen/teichoic acid export membrane protein